jgi:hypothetical protein
MDGLKLEDKLEINMIIWFQSLAEDEVGPSNRMIEDLDALALKGGFPVEDCRKSARSAGCSGKYC